MSAFEGYARDLASELRHHRHSDAAVEDILLEIMGDPAIDTGNPEATLGPAKDLAASYGKGTHRSRGFVVMSAAAAIAIGIGVLKLIASFVLGVEVPLTSTLMIYGTAILIFIVGVGVAAALDRRLPEAVLEQVRRAAAKV